MRPEIRKTLEGWRARATREAGAHRRASRRLEALNYRIGVPSVLLSAIVALEVFISLNSSVSLYIKLGAGFISVCAAGLSALQTFVRPALRAEQHRSVQLELERLLRDIEALFALGEQTSEKLAEKVDSLSGRLAEIQKGATAPKVADYEEISAHIPTLSRKIVALEAAEQQASEKLLAAKVDTLSARLAEIETTTSVGRKVAERVAAERREAAGDGGTQEGDE